MSDARIVILDSDEASARYLAAEFQKMGYQVAVAKSGKEGLIAAWRDRPHLIILDPIFTDITPAEYLDRLHKDARTTKTRVIAFSSLQDPAEVQRAIGLGFETYIAKESSALPVLIQKSEQAIADLRSGIERGGYIRQIKTYEKKGKQLVFLSAKGGVGTSSLCANIATMFKEKEPDARIAVVDLVLPVGSIASIVGYDGPLNIVEASIMDESEATVEYLSKAMPLIENWGFQLLAGSPDPAQTEEVDISRIPVLLNKLKSVFDYVFVDLGRSLSRISMPIILAADEIVLMLSLDQVTVSQTHKVLEFLRAKGLKRHQVYPLLNRAVGIEGLPKSEVEELLGFVMNSAIPHLGGNFSLANNLHQPVFKKYPDDVVAFSLREIYREIKMYMQRSEEEFDFSQ